MKKIATLILFALGVVMLLAMFGCKVERTERANRATMFATWAEPKARCVSLTTAQDLAQADTALCEIKGHNHWCISSANEPPTCKPYGAPPPAEQPTPAPQGQ